MGDFKVKGRIFSVDEKDISDGMKEFNISREDAVRMYFEEMEMIDPKDKTPITEVETTKAKRHYVKSDKPRKKTERVRKVDEQKRIILEKLASVIDAEKVIKNETEFSFSIDGNDYTVKLIKHRPKKE